MGQLAEVAEVNLSWSGERVLVPSDFMRLPTRQVRLRGSEPLVLRPWQIGIGYALSSGSVEGMSAGHFAEVSLRRGWTSSFARARIGATQGALTAESFSLQQNELLVALGGGLTFPVWLFELGLGVEGRVSFVHQQINRSDEEQAKRVFGIEESERSDRIYAAGPFLTAMLPLGDRVWISAELAGGVARVPLYDQTLSWRGSAQGRVGLGWSF